MKKGKDRLKLATIAWLKEPLRSWLTRAETQVPVTMAAISANYALPVIASPSGGCTDDTWTATSITNAPAGRYLHTAVWTGSEMIVWGGFDGSSNVEHWRAIQSQHRQLDEPPAPPMRPLAESVTRRCGLAAK